MTIATDFEIQADKDIRYIGAAHTLTGAGYYTVLELHRWLQDLADDAGSTGDDLLDISKETPSEKAFETIIELVNGFNIDDTAAEHLYGGSIIQSAGAVIYDGMQVIAAAGAHVEILQNGLLIANDFWNSIPFGSSDKGLNPDTANGISHRFMVKVRTGGADIDGRRLIFMTREWGYTFSEFKINGSGRGVNVAPLIYVIDLNNQTAEGTVGAWADITNLTAGYNGINVDGGGDQFFYSEWDKGAKSINQFYEYMKWLTRRANTTTLYGIPGNEFRGITHQITVDTPTGTFSAVETVTWSGGSGRMLAINSPTAPTKMWIQLLTGVAPTDNQVITGSTSAATCQVNVTVTERTLSQPFCGVSTGSAIIGAYGFGIEVNDLGVADKLFDLDNALAQPQNLVTFTVTGLVSGEDTVLVGPEDGSGGLDYDQLTLNTTLSGAAVTSVVVTAAIPADTPASGTIRIQRNNGAYSKHAYDSWAGSTFTLSVATDFSSNPATAPKNVFISYIDKEITGGATTAAFQTTYSSDRTLYVRRRDGGAASPTKTFETLATLGSASSSVAVQRLTDA